MARTVVKVKSRGIREMFDEWADRDGEKRAERVAAEMRANAPVASGDYRNSITVTRVEHPTRPVFQIGPHVPYGMIVEADRGTAARALDAAR